MKGSSRSSHLAPFQTVLIPPWLGTSALPLCRPRVTSDSLLTVLLAVLTACAQTEMKRVVGDNATLPCHHQFWVGDDPTLDIEWLLLKPTNRVVSDG